MQQAREYQHQARMMNLVLDFAQFSLGKIEGIINNEIAKDVADAEVATDQAFQQFGLELTGYTTDENGNVVLKTDEQGNPVGGIPMEEWGDRFTEFTQDYRQKTLDEMKLPGAKEAFEKRYDEMVRQAGKKIQDAQHEQMLAQQKVAWENDLFYWAEQNNQKKIDELLGATPMLQLYSPAELEKLKAEVERVQNFGIASREMQEIMTTDGTRAAMDYLYSEDVPALKESDRNRLVKSIERYREVVIDDEIGRLMELEANGTLTHEAIDKSQLPNGDSKGKLWWHDRLNAMDEATIKAMEEQAAMEQYKKDRDQFIDDANAIDVADPEAVQGFITKIEKSELKEVDQTDIRRIVNTRVKEHEAQLKEEEQAAEEQLKLRQEQDFSRAYEGIMSGEITSKDRYRDEELYPDLTVDDRIKLDKMLEDKLKEELPKKKKTDPEINEWLMRNEFNEEISNEEFMDYVLSHYDQLADGDYRNWSARARTRDATKDDPDRATAIDIVDKAFKVFNQWTEDPGEVAALRKEKGLLINDYVEWLEDNPDASTQEKLQKAEWMVSGFTKNKVSHILEELQQRRAARAGTLGLQEYREIVGDEPLKTSTKGQYVTYTDGRMLYRYNTDEDRLEYYDRKREKWRKAGGLF
jgi:hypothetical protein